MHILPSALNNQKLAKLQSLDNLVAELRSYQTVCGDININNIRSSKKWNQIGSFLMEKEPTEAALRLKNFDFRFFFRFLNMANYKIQTKKF